MKYLVLILTVIGFAVYYDLFVSEAENESIIILPTDKQTGRPVQELADSYEKNGVIAAEKVVELHKGQSSSENDENMDSVSDNKMDVIDLIGGYYDKNATGPEIQNEVTDDEPSIGVENVYGIPLEQPIDHIPIETHKSAGEERSEIADEP